MIASRNGKEVPNLTKTTRKGHPKRVSFVFAYDIHILGKPDAGVYQVVHGNMEL